MLTPSFEYTQTLNTQNKIISDLSSDQFANSLSALPRPIVFTNGCFDILHRGHSTYLEEARNLGASLIVGVNTDESVKRQNKGDDRPINTLDDRMAILASLACVDMVVSFSDDTPLELIKKTLPHHLVKGGDWPVAEIIGAKEVIQNGGEVHSLAFKYDRSTTNLINKIKGFIK